MGRFSGMTSPHSSRPQNRPRLSSDLQMNALLAYDATIQSSPAIHRVVLLRFTSPTTISIPVNIIQRKLRHVRGQVRIGFPSQCLGEQCMGMEVPSFRGVALQHVMAFNDLAKSLEAFDDLGGWLYGSLEVGSSAYSGKGVLKNK